MHLVVRPLGVILLVALVGCGGKTEADASDPDAGSGTPGADGSTVDTGISSNDAGVPTSDAGAKPPAPITCGTNVTCDPVAEECCLGFGGGGATAACGAKGKCPGGTVAVGCTSAANCSAGQVCCATYTGGGGGGGFGASAACAASCGGGGGGGGSAQVCASDAECAPGERCLQTPLLPGVGMCRAPRDGGGPPPPLDAGPMPTPDAG